MTQLTPNLLLSSDYPAIDCAHSSRRRLISSSVLRNLLPRTSWRYGDRSLWATISCSVNGDSTLAHFPCDLRAHNVVRIYIVEVDVASGRSTRKYNTPGSLQLRSTSRCVLRQLEGWTWTIFDASFEQIRATTRSRVRRNGRPFYGSSAVPLDRWLWKIFFLLYVAFYVPRCFHSAAVSVELRVEFREPRESGRRFLSGLAQHD